MKQVKEMQVHDTINTYEIYLLKSSKYYKIGTTSRTALQRSKENTYTHKDKYDKITESYKIVGTYADALYYESTARTMLEHIGLINVGNDHFLPNRNINERFIISTFQTSINTSIKMLEAMARII